MPAHRRPRLLSFAVVLVVVGNLAGLGKLLLGGEALRAQFPALTETALRALLVCPVVALIAATLLWCGRRLGLWLSLVDAVVVAGADLRYGMPIAHLAAVVALTTLLTIACVRAWRWLR